MAVELHDPRLPTRFWDKVRLDPETGCWLWTAAMAGPARARTGYIRWDGKTISAYRLAYRLLVGEIPASHELDHLCRVRACVNPNHLEAVTHRENMLRGRTIAAREAAKTCCPRGHAYDEANTAYCKGKRYCRECARAKARRRYYATRSPSDKRRVPDPA